MNALNPEELQNSSSCKSTVTTPGPFAAMTSCTASTNGFSSTDGLGVLIVPRNRTMKPRASAASSPEYFSSLTLIGAARPLNRDLAVSGILHSRFVGLRDSELPRCPDGDPAGIEAGVQI